MVVSLVVLVVNLCSGWNTTEAWEQEWVVKPGANPSHTAETMAAAIHRATEKHEYRDARTLVNALEADYKPSGKVFVRFTSAELFNTSVAVIISLLFLIAPISINYVRHGKARLWNRDT